MHELKFADFWKMCPNKKQEHSDIGPSAYFAKLGKKKVNEEKEIEKHWK